MPIHLALLCLVLLRFFVGTKIVSEVATVVHGMQLWYHLSFSLVREESPDSGMKIE